MAKSVPNHVQNILKTNFLDYFDILSKENQEKYVDYAIEFVQAYLERNKDFTTPEQDEFIYKLQEFKVECAYENRYGINERIRSERRPRIRALMQEVEEDFLNCEFLSQAQLLDGSNFSSVENKYGEGLARFASIILAREEAKVEVTGKGKAKLKIIEQIRHELLKKCSELEATFAHEERSLRTILTAQFALDEAASPYDDSEDEERE